MRAFPSACSGWGPCCFPGVSCPSRCSRAFLGCRGTQQPGLCKPGWDQGIWNTESANSSVWPAARLCSVRLAQAPASQRGGGGRKGQQLLQPAPAAPAGTHLKEFFPLCLQLTSANAEQLVPARRFIPPDSPDSRYAWPFGNALII